MEDTMFNLIKQCYGNLICRVAAFLNQQFQADKAFTTGKTTEKWKG
jgi:hypothetical protein